MKIVEKTFNKNKMRIAENYILSFDHNFVSQKAGFFQKSCTAQYIQYNTLLLVKTVGSIFLTIASSILPILVPFHLCFIKTTCALIFHGHFHVTLVSKFLSFKKFYCSWYRNFNAQIIFWYSYCGKLLLTTRESTTNKS